MFRPSKLNWGADIERTIPAEDVLPERPDPGGLAEIDPPNWAVYTLAKQGGRRHEKREITWQNNSRMGYFGAYSNASAGANQEAYEKAMRKREKQKQEPKRAARKEVARGNLPEDAYQLWRGNTYEIFGAQCRWCNTFIGSKEVFKKHGSETECKTALMLLYKFAKTLGKKQLCFSCAKETREKRWGIPLCNTVLCIGRWKFQPRASLSGFAQYVEWARMAQKQDPETGPFKGLSEETLKMGAWGDGVETHNLGVH